MSGRDLAVDRGEQGALGLKSARDGSNGGRAVLGHRHDWDWHLWCRSSTGWALSDGDSLSFTCCTVVGSAGRGREGGDVGDVLELHLCCLEIVYDETW